ncbi:tRNA epoxyqueuosine(34) reductase QueG [Caldanaerobacter sp.]|uniref:tRNA epoxyqueuosine(34) reductase QueG n=1 Tax=Caldanaerobacter sp. TaxID=2930036 RepID=UPI003C74FD03
MSCIKKEEVKAFAKSIGIDLIGFAPADCLKKYKFFLEERKKWGYECSIEERNPDKRVSPEFILSDVKSIISIALSYNVEYEIKVFDKNFGIISKSSWGRDYHLILREKMRNLCEFLKSECPEANMVSLVDNNPLLERAIAYHAGIGWFGKNGLIINEEYGSYLFLGEILINKYFEPDTPQESKCGDCDLCIKACPTKAIEKPYLVNANKCLSFITVKKGKIEEELSKKLGRRIYGCDTCQEVCPFNKRAKKVKREEFLPTNLLPRYSLLRILNMTNKEFREIFGPTASSWRGKNVIIRNAIIACVNLQNRDCVEHIKKHLKSESPLLRGYSAWALSYLEEEDKALEEIRKALKDEKDDFAAKMMEEALQRLER